MPTPSAPKLLLLRALVVLLLALTTAASATGAVGCAHVERAAAKDPQRCERDPKCQSRDRANDCTTQCVDDPACMDRCQQFNQQTGAGGR